MNRTDQILKQDAAGRVWTPRAQREAALDEFERSGLPAAKFAAQIGVKYQTFVAWKTKRRQERAAESVAEGPRAASGQISGWIEATVGHPCGGVLVVHLPGGARMEVSDGGQVLLAAHLLRSLGASGVGVAC